LGKLEFTEKPDLKKRLGPRLGRAYSDIENYNNSSDSDELENFLNKF
jgi:hypothetical protein